MEIFVKDLQLKKIRCPALSRESGRLMDVQLRHPSKAELPNTSSLDGKVTVVKERQ